MKRIKLRELEARRSGVRQSDLTAVGVIVESEGNHEEMPQCRNLCLLQAVSNGQTRLGLWICHMK